jgi:hypothetical protein
VIFAGVAVLAGAIAGSVDTADQPAEAWDRAGYRRNRWVWQAFGALCAPVALVYSGIYYIRVRPRVMRAARDLVAEQQACDPAQIRVPDPPLQQTRLRTSWLAVAITTGWFLLCFSALGILSLVNGNTAMGVTSLVGAVLGAAVTATNRRFGVTLSPEGIRLNGLTRRYIAWPDVVAITEQATFGTRYARVWTRTGPSRMLRVPTTQFGLGRRKYDADYALLQQWWHAYTPGSNGTPRFGT